MMKKAFAIALSAVLAIGVTACGGGQTTTREDTNAPAAAAAAANSNKKKVDPYSGAEIKIAYIAHDIGTPNNQGWKEGIERQCAPWSNIKIDSYGAEESAEKQTQIMTDCINQGYNAIILQCSDGTALAPSVKQAEEAGIPVITVNLDCASDTVHSALVMAVDDNLEKGFRDTIANYSGIKIVDAQSASFQKDTAMTVMNSFLQSYPDLKGVFAINDAMAEGAALAAESANKKGQICIWGADGEKDALTMIENGDMAGTIYTNSWDEGSTAAKIALLMIGSDYDSSALTETPKVIMEPIVVTKDTVGSIAPEDRW